MNLMVSGLPAHVSTHLGQATTVSAGSITTSMLMVDLNAIYVCWSKVIRDGYFSMSDFANIGNGYNVRVAEVLVRGQLWAESFASSAFIANAETF
jgi:lysozyme family protein